MLPSRTRADEDAWMAAWADGDSEKLIEAIGAALDARRPQLAARLLALVPATAEDDGGTLDRARKAAELFLVADPAADDAPELRISFAALRARRARRPSARLRRTLRLDDSDDDPPFPRRRR